MGVIDAAFQTLCFGLVGRHPFLSGSGCMSPSLDDCWEGSDQSSKTKVPVAPRTRRHAYSRARTSSKSGLLLTPKRLWCHTASTNLAMVQFCLHQLTMGVFFSSV